MYTMNDPMSEKLHNLTTFWVAPVVKDDSGTLLSGVLMLVVEEMVTDTQGRTSGRRTIHRYQVTRELMQRIHGTSKTFLAGEVVDS